MTIAILGFLSFLQHYYKNSQLQKHEQLTLRHAQSYRTTKKNRAAANHRGNGVWPWQQTDETGTPIGSSTFT